MPIQQPVRGLYRDRHRLVIDYQNNQVFPNRCMFTNKPITGLTRIMIRVVNEKTGFFKASLELDLPISSEWKGARDAATQFWGRLIWRVGMWAWVAAALTFALGTLLSSLHPAGNLSFPAGGYVVIATGVPAGVAIVGTIIGAAWPYIEVPTSSTAIIVFEMLPPYVWMHDIHPEFLEQLPKFEHPKVSFLQMLLGR